MKEVAAIIDVYDRKHSSPEIKSAVKLLINLLYLKNPLKLSNELVVPALDLVWQNCTDHKNHFYGLMSALLVDRRASYWLKSDSFLKVDQVIEETYISCTNSDVKNLKLQLLMLSQIAHHEP